jgi:hypothetical protein
MSDPTPCLGLWALFDSTNRRDHIAARALCATCPALAWCAQRARDLGRDHAYCRPLTGTWAGVLYGRPSGREPRVDPADEPDYTDAELRALHAAYTRGEHTAATRTGERIYQRERKQRNRRAA